MKITGIIAEYNPFHNGHAYQLRRAREETDADYLIVVMSGNFVQRGAPALLDKFVRAEMALLEGADLVIELPTLWATASAEYFAKAGVGLLELLGCVETLCYGCEIPDSELYQKLCQLFTEETPQYQKLLLCFLKAGLSYAYAREKAVLEIFSSEDKAAIRRLLRNPNSILAIEYQKAIAASASSIKTHPILRRGQMFHSDSVSDSFASASAIRKFLAGYQGDIGKSQTLYKAMPASAYELLKEYAAKYSFLFENDYSQMLHYCLLKGASDGYSDYADCTVSLSNKIRRNLNAYTNFTEFCKMLKTKDLSYTRISRSLIHILLNLKQNDYEDWLRHGGVHVPYARVLGFRKDSAALFTQIKRCASIPLITQAADAGKILVQEQELALFEQNLFADSIYRALVMAKSDFALQNEYCQPVKII